MNRKRFFKSKSLSSLEAKSLNKKCYIFQIFMVVKNSCFIYFISWSLDCGSWYGGPVRKYDIYVTKSLTISDPNVLLAGCRMSWSEYSLEFFKIFLTEFFQPYQKYTTLALMRNAKYKLGWSIVILDMFINLGRIYPPQKKMHPPSKLYNDSIIVARTFLEQSRYHLW